MPLLPFLTDISLETANKFYSWGWKASLIGAAITLIGVSFLMWGTKVRDHDFESQMAQLNSGAAKANENVAILARDAEALRTEALKAKEGIAKAQAQAAQANEKAESERLARVKLETRLADRKLTTEQQARLTSILKPFRGVEVDIVIFGDTPEIRTIGMVLYNCLRGAEWNVNLGSALGGMAKGIDVGVRMPTAEKTLNAARTFIAELQSVGIDSDLRDFDKMEIPGTSLGNLKMNTPMKIFIGSKP